MLCQICGKEKATFHFKEVIDGEVKELHLCEACAKERGLDEAFFIPDFSLPKLMTALTDLEIPLSPEKTDRCPTCGLSYEDIRDKGKLGCSSCYQSFKKNLASLLERIQGKTYHSGKVPMKGKTEIKKNKEIYELRKKLEEAVRGEEYEKAAELRDKIRKLEKGGNK